MKNLIKVGFLVSYDWHLLKNALPRVYQQADVIYLALDKKRLTWAGNPFDFNEKAFFEMIENIDTQKKIKVYEDDFYVVGFTSMQCEVQERNLLAQQMGEGGWHIQLDADEYFLDFEGFVAYLEKLPLHQKEINVCAFWINLFKKTETGFLYLIDETLTIQIATNKPYYEYGRKNGYFNHITPFFMVHDTWARSEEEIWQKISNWGHNKDFDTKKYFDIWKNIDESNYKQVKDFHPFEYRDRQKLAFFESENISELLQKFYPSSYPISKIQLAFKNNRNIARLKHLWNKWNKMINQ